jgi:UDP-N-acetylglucosamine--N-acetylmuramyl-(pentapeptide) pyrophosphoryl-undecaprenol N-acetylglucosamine transferase
VRLLIAGGGTGGHLFPGIAVAEEVMHRAGGEVLFVGTARGIEARVVPAAGYRLELLQVSGLARVGAAAFAGGLAKLPLALARSFAILRRFRPDVVLGVGGYASGPMVLAAALSRCPTAIQEQNSVPGVTNRLLARVVDRIFAGFADAFPARLASKVVVTGNPVRRALVERQASAAPNATANMPPRLLVVGGSQGARAVNELVLGAVAILAGQGVAAAQDRSAAGAPVQGAAAGVAALPALTLTHQAGASDAARCAERYEALGLGHKVQVQAFIDDMAAAYASATLVIARAGALTLAELAIAGRPAILVPLPTAAGDHQRKNAEAFARAGAALVMDERKSSPADVAAAIAGLVADRARLGAMARGMATLARPAAASEIVDRLAALVASRG